MAEIIELRLGHASVILFCWFNIFPVFLPESNIPTLLYQKFTTLA